MLQSPKKKIQRPRRLTSVAENPIFEAKQDNKRQQLQQQQRRQSQVPASYPTPSRQREGYRGQQHRRHYSVPDIMMLQSASPRQSNGHVYPAQNLDDTGIDVNCGHGQQHLTTMNNFNNFCALQPQRPRTPCNQHTGATPQTPFECFPAGNHDAAQMIDDILSSIGSPVSLTPRRGSTIATSPLQATFAMEECKEHDLHQQGNEISDPLPTPPHTEQLQSVSTFDLAPLPHPSFVSMAAVSMSSESEGESYYSPVSSVMSPAFSSVPSTPEMKHTTLYRCANANANAMPTVPEHATPSISSLPALDLPQLAPAPRHVPSTPSPVRVRVPAPHLTQSLGAKSSGITTEEISSFISGPDQDAKWLCLFPDCKKRFGRKENIKSHVQTHLGDRQYRCDACKKCFVRQHDLKRHSKIHTGVKPYPCLCGNSFARHDALTRHRQRGMCVGAFEGIVKKVVKRGRPRKKPLPEDDQKSKTEETSESSGGDILSGSSNSQTPYELPDFSSQLPTQSSSPQTSIFDEEDDVEATPRCRGNSPDFLTQSPGYSPPTSPSEEYDFESFVSPPPPSNRNSVGSSSLAESDFAPPLLYAAPALTDQVSPAKKFGGSFCSVDEYASSSGHEEFGLLSQDGMDMLGLTALERDPGILNFDDIYIKPEFMSSVEGGTFY